MNVYFRHGHSHAKDSNAWAPKSGKAFPRKAQRNDKAFLGAGVVRGPSVTEWPVCTQLAATGSPSPEYLQPKTVYLQRDTSHNRQYEVPSSNGSRCHFRVFMHNLTPAFLYRSVIFQCLSLFHSLTAPRWGSKSKAANRFQDHSKLLQDIFRSPHEWQGPSSQINVNKKC